MNSPMESTERQATESDVAAPVPAPSFGSWLRNLFGFRSGEGSARDTLEEIIDEREEQELPISADERTLLANILELRNRSVHDVMVPRADIVGIEENTSLTDVIKVITSEGHSRLPVFKETLDYTTGFIHAKDVLAWHGSADDFTPAKILRKVLFVAPSMQVLELLLVMRVDRAHMALVVDEYGGVDGLVTIEDLVEEIVGEIEDEHDNSPELKMQKTPEGGYIADARVTVEMLESELGPILDDEEREDLYTLGGLVFSLTGRIPSRGELVQHPSGLEFEILDADPRRIRRLRLHLHRKSPAAEAVSPASS
ncbi:MAG: HlyC/CorC family transporter [Rhodospirillales bacterium]|nr:HlyC/CorC family transporter [Rhodospirillales bacterium]